ncbi:MAG: hypothetical protein OXB84_00420 [Halobacteriovoraceae bacterium]|nr:hypothetical protein [Halobacteriovoraceae bacterium]
MNYTEQGQALLEYLLVFAAMCLIAVTLIKGFNKFMGSTVAGLNYQLSQQLSTGVCTRYCFYSGYENGNQ